MAGIPKSLSGSRGASAATAVEGDLVAFWKILDVLFHVVQRDVYSIRNGSGLLNLLWGADVDDHQGSGSLNFLLKVRDSDSFRGILSHKALKIAQPIGGSTHVAVQSFISG